MNQTNADHKLWSDFRKGSDYALAEIYNQYAEPLFRYGKQFTPNHDLIKDSLQDLFCNLIRRREKLGHTDNIYFYLLKSFRRDLLRNLKKLSKSTFTPLKPESPDDGFAQTVEDRIIQNENLDQEQKMILEGLKQLSPKQREIIYYRFTCEFEYDQICELMSLQYDSARKMVFRALKSLRETINRQNFILLFVDCESYVMVVKK